MSLQQARDFMNSFVVANIILHSFILVCCQENARPIVNITLGSIVGSILKSDNGRDFYAYRGIPYAKPPTKNLRFRDPEAIDEKWEGLLDATEDGPQCMQYDFILNGYVGDEDCLHLSVYKPVEVNEQLPVMVFIHGGAFICGSSIFYKPHRFMDKDVVLVVMNYRVGVLGFFDTEDELSPGNYAFLDQILALRWVQDNIAHFGGDPNKVTIFGNSAGAASVNLHLLSPLSKGLFHAAILQSGTALNDWSEPRTGHGIVRTARKIARNLQCPVDNNREMMNCLRKRPALDIVVQSSKVLRTEGYSFLSHGVALDKLSRGQNAFLSDHPRKLINEGRFPSVPVISGVNKNEGVIFLHWFANTFHSLVKFDYDDLHKFLSVFAVTVFQNGKDRQMLERIYNHYFRNKTSDAKHAAMVFADIVGDFVFTCGVDRTNEYLVKHDVPLYVYKLTYRGTHSILDGYEGSYPTEVTHVDELQYLFRCGYFLSDVLGNNDKKVSDIMLTLWTNFARNKIPDLNGSSHYDPSFKWTPMTSNNHHYLDISLTPKVLDGHLCNEYDFWNSLRNPARIKDDL